MPDSFVRTTRDGAVLVVLIDRPQARNALNPGILTAIAASLAAADENPEICATVLTGGPGNFSAGADIDVLSGHSPATYLASPTRRAFESIARAEKPIVAAVAGYCLGGGCELALACDLVVAGDNAVFGQPEINLGFIPGAGGTQLWRPRAGAGAQADAALLGELIDVWEARRIGLVDEVVPAEAVIDAALAKARTIAAKAPLASRAAKAALKSAGRMSMQSALEYEVTLMAGLLATEDAQEGTNAFLQKRPPQFKGR
ncbi:enoyl-CoA hydratase/isomerase family protein [Microvirga pudoricolor]|uniref:enoyl-CoA hydratase/isomerase family protein n=1 Tax=Microvirga pudoricolor TaxID=2778729 RepID=UPI00194E69F2|nr:enoyl-CoA hydratase-related protein [Microvirga pudoricolor]MBM6594423.1 enoyl-CoA hydratase/isomerase family protein [Microvirga pudoricolor]